MRRTHTTSRRGGLTVASAALVCLGGPALTACGASQDDGYVAVGADRSAKAERPKGEVSLVPLPGRRDGPRTPGTEKKSAQDGEGGAGGQRGGSGKSGKPESSAPASGDASGEASRDPSPSGTDGKGGSTDPAERPGGSGSGSDPGGPGSAPPKGPALLTAGKPERAKAADRWCEKVTVTFRNTGGQPVESGTVTFGTHVVDALGTDWATRKSSRKLPVPIAPGKKKEKTWTVCLDAWRVPLGMHVETRDVKVDGWR